MPVRKHERTIYFFMCETQVSGEENDNVLDNCVGSDEYLDKEDAIIKNGWKILDNEKVYCRSCVRLLIPKGLYCYTSLEIVPDKETGMRMKVKACPFYSTNHCALLNVEVDDQVKECSINDDIEDLLSK